MLYEIQHVSHSYTDGDAKLLVLDDVSLELEQGSITAIMGPSGSGKSTLLSILGTLEPLQNGTLIFNGQPMKDAVAFRQAEVGFVFQAYNLIGYLTARENVELGIHLAKRTAETLNVVLQKIQGVHTQNITPASNDAVATLLAFVGLDESKANRLVTKLSGGEQQRVAIARAIAKNPSLILCDEPTGNLDQQTAETVMDLFVQLAKKLDACVVIVTHDPSVAARADRILTMDPVLKRPVEVKQK